MSVDRNLEREVAVAFLEAAPSREPDSLYDSILSTTGRMRPRPRWLALIKEPPMRMSSRVAVGSPTARVTAILAATLLLAILGVGAVVAGASYLAGPSLLIVAQDGTGTVTTITEAVAMARDGDTIQIMPGTYAEHIVIDKAITLEGDPDSDRDAIVVTFTADSPQVRACLLWTTPGCGDETESEPRLPTAITLNGSDAAVRHLRVEGPDHGIAVLASGGVVRIEDLSLELAGVFMGLGRYGVFLHDGATGMVRDVTCVCSVGITKGSSPTVERLTQGPNDPLIINGPDTDPLVSDSTLGSVWVQEGAHATVTGSTILMAVGVGAGEVPEPPTVAELRDNIIDGAVNEEPYGVQTLDGRLILVGNTIRGQVTGLDIGFGDTPTVEGNTFEDNTTGIWVQGPASGLPEVLDGIQGNSFCGNLTDLAAPTGETVTMAGNEVCDAEPSNAP